MATPFSGVKLVMQLKALAGPVLAGAVIVSASLAAGAVEMPVQQINGEAPASIGPPREGRPITTPVAGPSCRARMLAPIAASEQLPGPRVTPRSLLSLPTGCELPHPEQIDTQAPDSQAHGFGLPGPERLDAGHDAGRNFELIESESPAPGESGSAPPGSTLAVEGTIPGVCVGGTNAGDVCTAQANCTGGGTCFFFRSEVYRNESNPYGFISCTLGPNCPEFLDDLTLNNALPFPPSRITSVEIGWIVRPGRTAAPGTCLGGPTPGAVCTSQSCGSGGNCTTLNAGQTMRVEVRFWDDVNASAPLPDPVNTGFLGGVSFLVPGPLNAGTAGAAYTNTVVIPFVSAIEPSKRSNLGLQVDFLDNATSMPTTAGSPLFAGGGVSVGSSANRFWTDDNAGGSFTSDESYFFTNGPPTLANAYGHLGAEVPTHELEPNDASATASPTASCITLHAAIDPMGDVDWYRFTLPAPALIESDVVCSAGGDDSTLTLRNAGGTPIEFNDDVSATNHSSRILTNLSAGAYLLEVHEKNDDGTIPAYDLKIGPPPPVVTNLTIGTACSSGCTDKHSIVWSPLSTGGPYDIVYGDLQLLHSSGLTASFGGCLGDNLGGPFSDDGDSPAPGEGFYYLSRGRDGCTGAAGTYDEGGETVSRDPMIPAPPQDCSRP